MAQDTLVQMRQLVRFLTKSPSQQLLTDAAIDFNINTFVLYDFPEELRLFDLHEQFTWYCQPNVDTYSTDTSVLPVTDPLYNFQNLYITVNPPVYVAGYQASYSQSREEFYRQWPQVDSIVQVGAGDAMTRNFTGTINSPNTNPGSPGTPILRNYVLFDSTDLNGNGMSWVDSPVQGMPNFGNLYMAGTVPTTAPTVVTPGNFINYITGQFSVTFPVAPGIGTPVNVQCYQYVASRPLSVLWFNNQFVLRPVPDQPYQINVEVYKRPTMLIASNSAPELEQWWQMYAYGAAVKILQNRFDYDSVGLIMPEFNKQKELVLRKTIVQNTNQRVSTIYSQQSDMGGGWGNWNGYGQSGI
jgi:hypothetical protein